QIVVDEERRRQKRGEHQTEQHQSAQRQFLGQPAHHAAFLPMMPCGRNSSTSTNMPKANMLLADGVKNKPASASVMPIRIPPSKAPGIEPSPPVITMTKARSV